MSDFEARAKFILELQHKVAQVRNTATEHANNATRYADYAAEQQTIADAFNANADRWQQLLDFAELVAVDDALDGEFQAARNARKEAAEAERRSHRRWPGCPLCFGPADTLDDEHLGRETDRAVESTGHLPGHADAEYFDQAEADDVREIRREMAIEAGDDSEALRQEAEDDAHSNRTDAEILAELRGVFGEPVEGRDFDVMPGTEERSE